MPSLAHTIPFPRMAGRFHVAGQLVVGFGYAITNALRPPFRVRRARAIASSRTAIRYTLDAYTLARRDPNANADWTMKASVTEVTIWAIGIVPTPDRSRIRCRKYWDCKSHQHSQDTYSQHRHSKHNNRLPLRLLRDHAAYDGGSVTRWLRAQSSKRLQGSNYSLCL